MADGTEKGQRGVKGGAIEEGDIKAAKLHWKTLKSRQLLN